MQSRYWKVRFVCGLTLLTLAGCYSYNPYGAGGNPGYYSAPPAGGIPQGVVPQNGFAPGGIPQQGPQTFSSPPSADADWQRTQRSRPVGGAQYIDPGVPHEVVVPDPGANIIVPPVDDFKFEQ